MSTRISFTLIHFIRSAWYYGVHDVLSYDPQKRVNGKLDASKKSAVLRSNQQFMTPEEESSSQSSSAHSSEDEEEQVKGETTAKISTQSVSPVPPSVKSEAPLSPAPARETIKVRKSANVEGKLMYVHDTLLSLNLFLDL